MPMRDCSSRIRNRGANRCGNVINKRNNGTNKRENGTNKRNYIVVSAQTYYVPRADRPRSTRKPQTISAQTTTLKRGKIVRNAGVAAYKGEYTIVYGKKAMRGAENVTTHAGISMTHAENLTIHTKISMTHAENLTTHAKQSQRAQKRLPHSPQRECGSLYQKGESGYAPVSPRAINLYFLSEISVLRWAHSPLRYPPPFCPSVLWPRGISQIFSPRGRWPRGD